MYKELKKIYDNNRLDVFAMAVGNLLDKQSLQLFEVYANIVRTDGLVGLSFVEIVGEDDGLRQSDDFLHLLH